MIIYIRYVCIYALFIRYVCIFPFSAMWLQARFQEIEMATAYRTLFQAPGSKAFTLAGLLARLPLPMTGIGIITLLSQAYGSYALAGQLVDHAGPRGGFALALTTGVVVLLVGLVASRSLHSHSAASLPAR